MNAAHFHLVVNHIPVLGSVAVLALIFYSLIRCHREVLLIAMGTAVIVGLLTIPAFLSGDGAEEVLESRPGFNEELVERHEDFSKYALISTELVALISAFALYRLRSTNNVSKQFLFGVAALAILNAGLMFYTANLGGQITHTEIRDLPAGIEPDSK